MFWSLNYPVLHLAHFLMSKESVNQVWFILKENTNVNGKTYLVKQKKTEDQASHNSDIPRRKDNPVQVLTLL